MAILTGNLKASVVQSYKGVVDIYNDRRLGVVARGWPRYATPTRTPAWRRTAASMRHAWEVIRSLSPEQIDDWKRVAGGGTKTAYDCIRSACMTAPEGEPDTIIPTGICPRYPHGSDLWIVEITVPESQGIEDGASTEDWTAYLGPTRQSILPRWIEGPAPQCPTRARRARLYPTFPNATTHAPVDWIASATVYTLTIPRAAILPPAWFTIIGPGTSGYPRIIHPA